MLENITIINSNAKKMSIEHLSTNIFFYLVIFK